MKVILDTNIFISVFIIGKNKADAVFLLTLIFSGNIELVMSAELFQEIKDTAAKKKFQRYFEATSSKEDFQEILEKIQTYSTISAVTSEIDLCRDKKDNFLLNLSQDSNADLLVTGDQDLLVIEKINSTKIITWINFKALFDYQL